jgi:hypothetical protein
MCLIVIWIFICRYCVSFFASDATGGAEFVMFDRVGVAAVGKHLMTLMHQRYPGHSTVDEIVAVARHDTGIPAEISRLVSQKYKLLVSISKKWKTGNNVDEPLAFQVCRIIETYKPELPPLGFAPGLVSTALLSSAGGSGTRTPPLGPVMSPGLHTPHASGSPHNQAFHAGYGSHVAQVILWTWLMCVGSFFVIYFSFVNVDMFCWNIGSCLTCCYA